jgi:hypothetical protein
LRHLPHHHHQSLPLLCWLLLLRLQQLLRLLLCCVVSLAAHRPHLLLLLLFLQSCLEMALGYYGHLLQRCLALQWVRQPQILQILQQQVHLLLVIQLSTMMHPVHCLLRWRLPTGCAAASCHQHLCQLLLVVLQEWQSRWSGRCHLLLQ